MSFGMTMWNLNIEKKQKADTRYMDTDSFLVYVKTNHIYEVIAEDVEKKQKVKTRYMDTDKTNHIR